MQTDASVYGSSISQGVEPTKGVGGLGRVGAGVATSEQRGRLTNANRGDDDVGDGEKGRAPRWRRMPG